MPSLTRPWWVYRPDDGAGTGGDGGDPAALPDPPAGGGKDGGKDDRTPEQLRDALTAANREAAKYRTERKALEDRIAALEGERLSDQEKLERRANDAEKGLEGATTRIRGLEVRLAVAELATAIGIVDAEAAVALLDTTRVKFDGDAPDRKEIEAELRALVKRKPYLVRHGSADGGGGGQEGDGNVADINGMIRKAAGRIG